MTIVIVEDEPRTREGLAKAISRLDPRCRVLGLAESGAEGLRMISELRPSLVITDVRMPGIDGLEMLSRARALPYRFDAIVLSAYSEFAYAQQAILLGIDEYLLKPVDVEALASAIRRIEGRIEAARDAQDEKEANDALDGLLGLAMLGGCGASLGLQAEPPRRSEGEDQEEYCLVVVHLGERQYEREGERIVGLARSSLASAVGPDCRLVESPLAGRFCLLVKSADASSAMEGICGPFMDRMRLSGIPELRVGAARARGRSALKEAAVGLNSSLEWGLTLEPGAVVRWPEATLAPRLALPYPGQLENRVRSALCSMDRRGFEAAVAELMELLRASATSSPKDIKATMARFVIGVLNTINNIECGSSDCPDGRDILDLVKASVSWAELDEAAGRLLALFPGPLGAAEPKDASIARRAKKIVLEAYAQGITLGEVAERIEVTPEYLSAVFHRDEGITFSSYIRDFRVRKAKELLLGTGLKLYEVGERVGYKDSKYFCRVFKEATGIKPSEFRKANR